jgi:predicted secreted Zn-dependent protease
MGIRTMIAAAALAAALPAGLLAAPPLERVETAYYDVTGQTADELRRQMSKKGPNGFWAYTRWYVRWSETCRVDLEISFTLPRLSDRNRVPLPLRSRWDSMLEKLIAHEEQHAEHGRAAAREVAAANCKNARAIIKSWAAEDKAYDKRTRHGSTEGVDLDR